MTTYRTFQDGTAIERYTLVVYEGGSWKRVPREPFGVVGISF